MDEAQLGRVRAWVDGYVRAWGSNDPADIRALFSEDAAYYTEPHGQPWLGADEIVECEVDWHPLVVTPEVAVVQGEVAYPAEGNAYSNLWVIRLDGDGRCS